MTKKPAYPDELGKPFNIKFPRPPNPLFGPSAWEAYRRDVQKIQAVIDTERAKRWQLLRDFYSFDADCSWQDMAETLAAVHVPGMKFQEPPKVGRRPKWSAASLSSLRKSIDTHVRTGVTVKEAVARLKKEGKYQEAESTLKTLYYAGNRGAKIQTR